MNLGSNIDVPKLVRTVAPLASPQLRQQQVRLLLRGKEGLASRVYKAQYDPVKTKQSLLETALKYGIAIKETEPRQAPPQASKQPADKHESVSKAPGQDGSWVKVAGRKASRVKQDKPQEPSQNQTRYSLEPSEWSHPFMERFQVAKDGVHLESDLAVAERHGKQVQGTRNNVALITTLSVQPSK